MTCHQCGHNFCWQCLVSYNGPVVHRQGCPHAVRDVAADQRNWVAEDMNMTQINNLFARGGRMVDGEPVLAAPMFQPPLPPPAQAQAPAINFLPTGFFQALWGGGNVGG
jgi:hypothetical protein